MDNTMLKMIRRELTGWQIWEVVYVIFCTVTITVISFQLGSNCLGIASAVTGTLYTMLAGKGKISCYFFGIFNSVAYGYIAFDAKLYGDAMLNWFWYLPMMFAGICFWRRQMDADNCVIKNHLSFKAKVIGTLALVSGIAVYAAFLMYLRGAQPWVDAATTVLSVAAMILTVKRCVEQWLMWILVNSISVGMWLKIWLNDGNSIATLLWWVIMLITGMIFYWQWLGAVKRESASIDLQKIGSCGQTGS